jgi:formylglycine-generating enzyme required for sulfatase activity
MAFPLFVKRHVWLLLSSWIFCASCASTRQASKTPLIPGALVNSLGMTFLPVAGTDVLFSRHETRVADYAAFARATGREWSRPSFRQTNRHPAVNVSWHDAKAFCNWLSKREGRRYRLPTEREWRLACEDEPEKIIPGAGNFCDESFGRRFGSGYDAAWLRGYDDGHAVTAPAGSYSPSRDGLHDLRGNVWEWCEDWIHPAEQRYKVLLGASWRTGDAKRLRHAFRGPDPPSVRIDSVGFRVVMERD